MNAKLERPVDLSGAKEQFARNLVATVEGKGGTVWFDPNEGERGTLWVDLLGRETVDLRASIEVHSDAVIEFLKRRPEHMVKAR